MQLIIESSILETRTKMSQLDHEESHNENNISIGDVQDIVNHISNGNKENIKAIGDLAHEVDLLKTISQTELSKLEDIPDECKSNSKNGDTNQTDDVNNSNVEIKNVSLIATIEEAVITNGNSNGENTLRLNEDTKIIKDEASESVDDSLLSKRVTENINNLTNTPEVTLSLRNKDENEIEENIIESKLENKLLDELETSSDTCEKNNIENKLEEEFVHEKQVITPEANNEQNVQEVQSFQSKDDFISEKVTYSGDKLERDQLKTNEDLLSKKCNEEIKLDSVNDLADNSCNFEDSEKSTFIVENTSATCATETVQRTETITLPTENLLVDTKLVSQDLLNKDSFDIMSKVSEDISDISEVDSTKKTDIEECKELPSDELGNENIIEAKNSGSVLNESLPKENSKEAKSEQDSESVTNNRKYVNAKSPFSEDNVQSLQVSNNSDIEIQEISKDNASENVQDIQMDEVIDLDEPDEIFPSSDRITGDKNVAEVKEDINMVTVDVSEDDMEPSKEGPIEIIDLDETKASTKETESEVMDVDEISDDKETLALNKTISEEMDVSNIGEDIKEFEKFSNKIKANELKKTTDTSDHAEVKVQKVNKETGVLDQSETKGNAENAIEKPALNENLTSNKSESTLASPDKLRTSNLANTLDILSDEEDENVHKETVIGDDKKCINVEDDDDIVVVSEDSENKKSVDLSADIQKLDESAKGQSENENSVEEPNKITESELRPKKDDEDQKILKASTVLEKMKTDKPPTAKESRLVPDDILKMCKKNIADMSRQELEEFCILKIVESVIDKASLNDIKVKLKTMAQSLEESKKKAMMLTKQNRDIQVVLKSVQEELKKGPGNVITPLKITRSVGMQVFMTEKAAVGQKKRPNVPLASSQITNAFKPTNAPASSPRLQKPPNQPIPVPRLVPANAVKNTPQGKNVTAPNITKVTPPAQKAPEKRSRLSSVTVDLTDDEPPAKATKNNSVNQPNSVRLVPSQNLLAVNQQRPTITQHNINSPRKVYIPISGSQPHQARQSLVLKSPTNAPALRGPAPSMVKIPPNVIRRPTLRHPAPLPDVMKQFQPPNWKALPPAPDLKLSKVENGTVISWKIEGYQEDSYEEIASYQLFAYQETSSPPSTALWKKIGDVKALPLPMACTLTQFRAGFKYYFAVRAVDIRSRLGPFSLPGSILLLNKT